MNLAGNSLYWKCTIKNNQLEVRKSGDYHSHDNKPGGYWKYLESQISVSVFNLMGAYYSYGDDANNSYKYKITKKNHWAYKDINSNFMGEDNLNIRSFIKSVTKTSFVMNQFISKDDNIIVEAQVHLVFVNDKSKPIKVPQIIFDNLKPYFCDSIKL